MKTIQKMFALLLAALSFSVATRAEEQPKTQTYDVVLLTQGDSIIMSVKAVREANPGMGIADALNLVKAVPKTVKSGASKEDADKLLAVFDKNFAKAEIKDSTGKVVATTTIVPEVPGKFDLLLKKFPEENKIFVIRLTQDLTGLGIEDSKKLVESLPALLKAGKSNGEIQKYKRLFETNKSEVEVKESGK